jgi:hypothetical protein
LPLFGGLLLQMPFESGSMLAVVLLLARWLGNPIPALHYTWNSISHTRRACRLFARLTSDGYFPPASQRGGESGFQMSDLLHEPTTVLNSDHSDNQVHAASDLRDGLYLLMVLDQYQLVPGSVPGCSLAAIDDMFKVLCFALFSTRSRPYPENVVAAAAAAAADNVARSESSRRRSDTDRLLRDVCRRRAELAEDLRAARKRSVVPVFISLFWFAVSLAISISKAFRTENASTRNLALGLQMTWLPALVACAIVDRNPASSRHARRQLQQFLDASAAAASEALGVTASGPYADVSDAAAVADHDAGGEQQPSPQQTSGAAAENHIAQPPEAAVAVPSHVPPEAGYVSLSPVFQSEAMFFASTKLLSVLLQLPSTTFTSAPSHFESAPHDTEMQPDALQQQLPTPRILEFCGQGRRAISCGVAHAVLLYLEDTLIFSTCNCFMRQRRDSCHCGPPNAERGRCSAACRAKARFKVFFDVFSSPGMLIAMLALLFSSMGGFMMAANINTSIDSCSFHQHLFYLVVALICAGLEADGPIRYKYLYHAALTSIELINCAWLVMFMLGRPLGLFNSCACNRNYYRNVSLSPFPNKPHRQWTILSTIVGCLPLLIVVYAIHAWCMLSFLSSYDFAAAMRGLQRIRRMRYILRGKWLSSLVQNVRRRFRTNS